MNPPRIGALGANVAKRQQGVLIGGLLVAFCCWSAVRGSPTHHLYVQSGPFVDVFSVGAKGNVAPERSFQFASEGSMGEGFLQLSFDSSGYVYTAPDSYTPQIDVYAPSPSGNPQPVRVISGSDSQLQIPIGVAVDGAGYLYV